jgi:hypothetical protein
MYLWPRIPSALQWPLTRSPVGNKPCVLAAECNHVACAAAVQRHLVLPLQPHTSHAGILAHLLLQGCLHRSASMHQAYLLLHGSSCKPLTRRQAQY